MKLKRFFALLLAAVMLFTLAACGEDEKTDTGDQPVATIGETVITYDQLGKYTYLYCFLQGIDLSAATAENLEYVKSIVLEDYIAIKLMELEYADDPDVLPEDHQTAADDFVAKVAEKEEAKTYMEKYGIPDEFLKEFFITQYYNMAFFEDLTAEIPKPTEKEAKTYFDENPEQFVIDEVTASHILVKDEKLAKELLAELKNGADFEALAKENSIDTVSAAQGGSLGTFGRGAMVAEFEQVAFALKPGEISDVVKTQFGYHIIKVSDKEQGNETFEDMKDTILSSLYDNAVREAYNARITELRDQYGVEYAKK